MLEFSAVDTSDLFFPQCFCNELFNGVLMNFAMTLKENYL